MALIGAEVLRKEDAKLLTGQGRFVDGIAVPGMVWLAVVRSPYGHARIRSVDVSAALAAEGVVAACSGEDLAGDFATPFPCTAPVNRATPLPAHWPLARDKARYAGDGVAVVVAASQALAEDAAELVEVDYEPLPVVTDVEAALAEGAPLVHEELGTNVWYSLEHPSPEVDKVFAEAAVTIKERYRQQRLVPNAIETRAALVVPSPGTGELTFYTTTQAPHGVRSVLAGVVGIPEARLRVIAPDVGGGFGAKFNFYPEDALCLALARRLGLPVKWVEGRSESFVATTHGRDVVQEIELAATEEGKIRGVRVRLTASVGAYLKAVGPSVPLFGSSLYGGCYEIEAYDFGCTAVFTNTTPVDAYRGAGRPEAAYAIERTVDALARKLGRDPAEIRRLNFITEFPAAVASGAMYDSGDYHACLDKALALAGYDELRAEQAARNEREEPRRLGIGLSTYIELAGFGPSKLLGMLGADTGGWELGSVRCLPTGSVQIVTGSSSHGQGHETAFAQLVADRLGVDLDAVDFVSGDTAIVPAGIGTFGSRSLSVGGTALYHAAGRVLEKARKIVAHQLEAAEDDLDFEAGRFSVKGSPERGMTLQEVAYAAATAHNLPDGMEPVLDGTCVFDPTGLNAPSGAHVAVVEVDTETGDVRLVRYVAVDDVGRVINPLIVDGQVQGGIAQGVAQALYEEAVYDEDGNLLTGSLVSYLVPSAAELPSFELDRIETPSPTNPLGVKGVGETGTIGSPPAVINAVVDALQPFGIGTLDMPASPERVWRALQEVST